MKGGPALFTAAALAAMLAGAPAASAQESGAYLGAAIGQAKLTEWCDSSALTSCKDTDTAWKLFGGYRFNRYLAAEASYIDWGEVRASIGTASGSAKQQSYGIAAVGSLPLGASFAVFAKLGYARTEQDTTNASGTVNRHDGETHYGVGARYHFGPNWSVRGEWERTDKLKVEMLSVGAEYRF